MKNVLQFSALLAVIGIALYAGAKPRVPQGKATTSRTGKFLFISDVHLDPNLPVTTVYRQQDAGMDLWAAFQWKVDQVMQSPGAPEFVVYTGDLPVHVPAACEMLEGEVAGEHDTAISLVLNGLQRISEKYGVPVFYLPGNNDALDGDYMPFAGAGGQTPLSLVKPSAQLFPTNCGKDGGSALISCYPEKGYYSAYAQPGLRLVALNTVIYNNTGCTYNGQAADCAQQMLWLRLQLSEARQKGEKCYLAMHIPPGGSYNGWPMWNTTGGNWTDTLLALTAQYSATIAGVLYGHTHMDEMRLLYAPQADTVTAVAISCPGISILHNNNPGFKVVTFDRGSSEFLDFTTYYTNINVSAKSWPLSYNFANVFGSTKGQTIRQRVKSMSPGSLVSRLAYIYNVRHNGSASAQTIQNFYMVTAQSNP